MNPATTAASPRRWLALVFICLALLIISIDNTVLNVALPAISRQFGATTSDLQWMVDAYPLLFATLLLTMGTLGDRFGRKLLLLIGVVWFAGASILAGLSTSSTMLIGARGILGIGGAMIMPSTLSIITATFRDRQERARAIAAFAAVFGLGLGLGPVVGGFLVDRFTWSAVFFINPPIAALSFLGTVLWIDESRDPHLRQLDIPGILLSIGGLFGLVYGIIQAGNTSWTDSTVLLAFGVAAVLLAVFAVWEARSASAMLPLYFFRSRTFSFANLSLVLVMFANAGSIFFLQQYLQSVQGHTALDAGLLLLPLSIVVMTVSGLSAALSHRFGKKVTTGSALLIAAGGLAYFAWATTTNAPYLAILPALVIAGMGFGLVFPLATDAVMSAVPVNRASIGSAMNDTTRMLGGALGVAVLGTIMNQIYLHDVQSLATSIPQQAYQGVKESIQGAQIVAHHAPPQLAHTVLDTANQAFVSGMHSALLVGALLLSVAAVLAFAFLPRDIQHIADASEASEEEIAVPPLVATAVRE